MSLPIARPIMNAVEFGAAPHNVDYNALLVCVGFEEAVQGGAGLLQLQI